MAESVYKVVELVGTSTVSWEKAAAAAVSLASKSLRDLRVATVTQLDMHIVDGKVAAYRAKVSLSFKYENGDSDSDMAPKPRARAKAAPAPEPAVEEAPPAKKAAAKKGKRKPAKG
ncbi:MAG TPA: dodecin family protein [Polyangiaceae bacterium]|jgi:hypothetical protein|nr:dodecin family protein [Polyangiaceae bacterium]